MDTEHNEQFQYSDGASGSPPPSYQSHTGEKVVDQARRIASTTQREVTDQVRSGVDSAKQRAADTLNTVAQSLVRATEQSDGEPNRYVQRTGEQVQRVADYLQNTDVRRIITQTESFARRQPALFLGGAFAVGILAARFLKNSSRQEQDYSPNLPVRRENGDWDRGPYDRERTMSSSREGTGTGARSDPVRYDERGTSASRDTDLTDQGTIPGAGTARNSADGGYGSSWSTGTSGGTTSGAPDGATGTGGPTGDR